jgi:beta-N-acetylhexosaminidase
MPSRRSREHAMTGEHAHAETSAPDPDPARRLCIGYPGLDTDEAIRRIEQSGAAFVILFARNIESADQVRRDIERIRAAFDRPLAFCIDQEGGDVVRFDRDVTPFPGNMALGATGDPQLALEQGRITGAQLRALGFDIDFAPVLDVLETGYNPGVGQRSFGRSTLAVRLGAAHVRGLIEGGITPVIKHFPGLGAAVSDPHVSLPVIDLDPDTLRRVHVEPFARALEGGASAVMTSHPIYRGLGDDVPATFSRRIAHDLLRAELGFDGVLFCDDLEMGAIIDHGGFDDAVRHAAAAGHDVVLVCHDADRQARAAAVLRESAERANTDALRRIDVLLERTTEPRPDFIPDDGVILERTIAARAVTVLGDPTGALPLTPAPGAVALMPHLVTRGAAQGAADAILPDYVESIIHERFPGCRVIGYPPDLGAADARALLDRTRTAARRLIFIDDAHMFDGQRAILEDASLDPATTAIIHLRSPFGHALQRHQCAALTAYGYRSAHLVAVLDALVGCAHAPGRLPIDLG